MNIDGQPVAVCFVSNMGYLQHFCAALVSFLKVNQGSHEIFLFNEDISSQTIVVLQKMVERESPHSILIDQKLDTSRLPKFSGYWEKLGVQVFHRLLIAEELPKRFNYALYLDADIIFQNAIQFEGLPFSEFSVFAVRDTISHILAPKRGLEKYFNAGIMLLNVARWRELDAVNRLLTHTPKVTRFAEQELLNEVFADDWHELPSRFNYAANRLRIDGLNYRMSNGETPVIIHYLGGVKPWKYWVRGSFLYWKYVWQTPFKGSILRAPKTVLNSLVHLLKKLF